MYYQIIKEDAKKMQRLTKAEEQVMQIIWTKQSCMVSEILADLGEPKPPHSTVSSVVRILEKKGFVTHKAYGRTYVYSPTITLDDYKKFELGKMASGYFGGSMKRLVSFLVKEKDLDLTDLAEMIKDLENSEKDKK